MNYPFCHFYLLKIFNIFNTFRNTTNKITKMATVRNLSELVKSKFLQLSGGTLTGNLGIKKGYDALSLTIPSGSDYTDMSFKNSSGERRAFVRVRENDTAIEHSTQLYVKENSNQYPINFTISFSKSTKNTYAKINSNRINTVTSSWRSDNLWYRVYDDGYIEQGGLLIPSSGDDNYLEVIITLPVSFTNANYSAVATGTYTTTTQSDSSICVKKTTTQVGFKVHSYKDVGYPSFYCCGY